MSEAVAGPPGSPDDVAPAAALSVPRSPRRATLPAVAPKPRLSAAGRAVGRVLARLILTMRVRGLVHVPAHGPVLIAGNHAGFLDGPLVAMFVPRPASFLAKSELFRGPVAAGLGWFGQIPVDRGRPDRDALRRAAAVLESGGVLGMFPEGTRGRGGVLAEVQHGVGYLALKYPDVPIVPVACVGTERALPKGAKLPRYGARVDVVFGPPFRISPASPPHSRRTVGQAAEQIRVRLAEHYAAVDKERRQR